MSTAAATAAGRTRADANPWGPRASTRRALALLRGGVLGAHAAALLAVGISVVVAGRAGAGWSLMAAAIVLVFFVLGQAVQVIVAEQDPMTVLGASMASFVVRAAGLGALLAFATRHPDAVASLAPVPVILTALLVALGWMLGEIQAFRRLRIPVYDTEYVPSPDVPEPGEERL